MITVNYLPPPLVHELRSRSFPRLFRMTGSPGNRGFGRVLRQRIRSLIDREHTLIEKAITLAYLGSFLVDHIVFAEKTACQILEKRDLTETEEKQLWDSHYHNVIETLAAEHAERERILEYLGLLERYSRLPETIHRARTRHWGMMNTILARPAAPDQPEVDEVSILRKVQFILSSGRRAESKARLICIAASLLADRQCWCRHVPWPAAYMQIMTDLYPFLAQHPQVMDKIIRLS
ncbi:MAG TPA: hypothetical protein PKE26_15180 [Kiritimatiellia bacterium]|nr:hypothetical protein [Kiritimatiellia bacterium]HMP00438.1 hypothetical protein [Kiritimatiellia bacterium]HMP97333.1 hypothetical protein [Kiritimatiellia bacterium]